MLQDPWTAAFALALFVVLAGCAEDEDPLGPPGPGGFRTWRVLPDGSGDRPTIQEAIDGARSGDTIAVAAGTYRERLRIAKSIRLLGGWDPTFEVNDPSAYPTVLDGEYSGTVVAVENLPDTAAVVDGFVVTQGGPPLRAARWSAAGSSAPADLAGSGIFCENASPILSRNVIRENTAPYGAGILCRRGAARIRNNTISGNHARQKGGGILCLEFAGVIEGNRVFENAADGEGGGLYVSASEASIERTEIVENDAGRSGGGVALEFADVQFRSVCIEGNGAVSFGGGVFVDGQSSVSFEGSRIEGNRTNASGGGVYCRQGCEVVLVSCEISDNCARGGGGGVYSSAAATLVGTWLCRNEADMGGGLYSATGGDADLRRCLIETNGAQTGGGVSVDCGSVVRLYRNTLVDNEGSIAGGGLYLIGGQAVLEANLVVGSVDGEGIYCWPDAELTISINDVWGNADGDYGGACEAPEDPDPDGNFSADPLFCAPETGDYSLQPGSPAVLVGGDTLGAFGCGCRVWEGARDER